MVYRIYVEKKAGLDNEAAALKSEISTFLGIKSVDRVRILNRYDAENITGELFDWIYIDFDTLSMYAEEHGFICEKCIDGEHYDYLTRITLK